MGSLAGSGVLATTFIALGCASLAGCAPQSDGAFHAIADPAPNAAALQPQPPPMASGGRRRCRKFGCGFQPQPGGGHPAHASTSDYRIMSGDVLQITVFQVQDFNRDAQVDAGGNIVLPLIGGVPAAGKTVHEVESEIAGRLRAKYLQNPQVLVTIKDAVGLRVSVQGAVKNSWRPTDTRRHNAYHGARPSAGIHRYGG